MYSLTATFSFSWLIWSDVKANSGVRHDSVDGSCSMVEFDLGFALKPDFTEFLEGVLDLLLVADELLVLVFFLFGVVDPCRLLLLRPRVAERVPVISFPIIMLCCNLGLIDEKCVSYFLFSFCSSRSHKAVLYVC